MGCKVTMLVSGIWFNLILLKLVPQPPVWMLAPIALTMGISGVSVMYSEWSVKEVDRDGMRVP